VHLRAGDRMILRPGFKGTWEVIETTRKDYVIVQALIPHPDEHSRRLRCAYVLRRLRRHLAGWTRQLGKGAGKIGRRDHIHRASKAFRRLGAECLVEAGLSVLPAALASVHSLSPPVGQAHALDASVADIGHELDKPSRSSGFSVCPSAERSITIVSASIFSGVSPPILIWVTRYIV
jgi:hypothetical protein